MAVLVVLGPLVIVGQDLIGLVDLLEALLAALVSGVQVRMIFLGQLPVRLFYFFRLGAFLQAKHLIIVSFFCHITLLEYAHLGGENSA